MSVATKPEIADIPAASEPFPYPGIPSTSDGAGMVAWVETNITEGGCAYPITSSTTMGQGYQAAVADGRQNLWGTMLSFLELESEHSSASTCEGYAVAGGRVTNFTSGQGLILMKEVLYTISGKRLPIVFHIGARALTSQGLNVHAGHDDVMGVADCGWGILFGRTAQEAGDLALIARRAAEDSATPFMNVQDGFLTTHTIENVLFPELDMMREFIGDPRLKLVNLMDVANPIMSGVVQNQDSYMKGKIAQRWFYDRVPQALRRAFQEFYQLTGRRYDFVEPYRLEDADLALVGMGCYMETARATIDYLRETRGLKIGCLNITAFRPFPGPQIVDALRHVRGISVLERMDNPLAQSNPLTCEVKAAFIDSLAGAPGYPEITHVPQIYSGSAGLGSRDVRPGHLIAVAENMLHPEPQRYFVLGIQHELALPPAIDPDLRPQGAFSMRGHSVGGFGSVTTNKLIATIAADLFGMEVQAYPKYGSEKKGLPTTYYLTLAKDKILVHSELKQVEFVPLNDVNAFNQGNPLGGIMDNGMCFVQTHHVDPADVWRDIPPYARRAVKEQNIRVLFLDTVKIARELAPSGDLAMRMQGVVLLGIFLRSTPFQRQKGLSDDEIFAGVEKSIRKTWGRKGEAVVEANLRAVKRGFTEVFEIPRDLIEATPAEDLVGEPVGGGFSSC